MIRALPLLAFAPLLSGCGLEELFSPGSSQARYEYRQAGLIQPPKAQEAAHIPQTPIPPTVEVAEAAPEVVEVVVPEPVYVPPPRQPDCIHDLYAIYRCVDGVPVML